VFRLVEAPVAALTWRDRTAAVVPGAILHAEPRGAVP
jgi:hypothetical protein